MKPELSILGWLAILTLVWAAGHDILSGEPDVWMEWTIVVAGMLLALVVLIRKLRRILRK